MKKSGKEYGIEVMEAPVVKGVSSTNIRRALAEGDTVAAARMLGRRFSISGIVTHGRELGRSLGFPTANIKTDASLLLPAPRRICGRRHSERRQPLPRRSEYRHSPDHKPGLPLTTEAHLTGFSGNLYDSELRLEFLRRLRDEKKNSATYPNLKPELQTT